MYPGTVIKDNQAGQNGGGVAIWNLKKGSYTLGSGVTISGNQAQGDGGGFYVNCNKITYEEEDAFADFDMSTIDTTLQIANFTNDWSGVVLGKTKKIAVEKLRENPKLNDRIFLNHVDDFVKTGTLGASEEEVRDGLIKALNLDCEMVIAIGEAATKFKSVVFEL